MTKQPNLKTIGWIKMKDDFFKQFYSCKFENRKPGKY